MDICDMVLLDNDMFIKEKIRLKWYWFIFIWLYVYFILLFVIIGGIFIYINMDYVCFNGSIVK